MNLEDVFCSKPRMKALKLLFQLGQLNTSDLAHRLGANCETTLRHLSPLKKEDLVTERRSGKTRFFSIHRHVEGASCDEATGRVGAIICFFIKSLLRLR